MNSESNDQKNGTVTIEGEHAILQYKRILPHSLEDVWKTITEPEQLSKWFSTKATIDGRPGGKIEFITGPSGFHTTGKILVWDPPHVFEHEWHIAPHQHIPKGESESIIRWELTLKDDFTLLTVTHRRLSKSTALGFAPGMHAFLDRLEAHLNHDMLPDWMERYAAVQVFYPSWQR